MILRLITVAPQRASSGFCQSSVTRVLPGTPRRLLTASVDSGRAELLQFRSGASDVVMPCRLTASQ